MPTKSIEDPPAPSYGSDTILTAFLKATCLQKIEPDKTVYLYNIMCMHGYLHLATYTDSTMRLILFYCLVNCVCCMPITICRLIIIRLPEKTCYHVEGNVVERLWDNLAQSNDGSITVCPGILLCMAPALLDWVEFAMELR